MYNSLPWEEDITRVYVWRPVGFVALRGFYGFPRKKVTFGVLWMQGGAGGGICIFVCMTLCVYCGLREKENRTKC